MFVGAFFKQLVNRKPVTGAALKKIFGLDVIIGMYMYSKTYQLSFNVYCKKHMSLTVIHPSLRDISAPDDLHIQNLTRSVFHLQGIQKERIHHLSLCLILIVSQSALKLLHLHR